MAFPCWMATTRRVVNERPSRIPVDLVEDGHGRVARGAGSRRGGEWTGRSSPTVRAAANRAWPATCPPNTRWRSSSGLTPPEDVDLDGLQVEQVDEVVERFGHLTILARSRPTSALAERRRSGRRRRGL